MDNCNQLLELEPDSKWTLYTKVLILKALDSQTHHEVGTKKKCRYQNNMHEIWPVSDIFFDVLRIQDIFVGILFWLDLVGSFISFFKCIINVKSNNLGWEHFQCLANHRKLWSGSDLLWYFVSKNMSKFLITIWLTPVLIFLG